MIIFYIIMSIIFALLSFMVSRANDNSMKASVLISIFFLLFWPIVMTVLTIYLFVLQVKHGKHATDNIENSSEENVDLSDGQPLNWTKIMSEDEVEETVDTQ